jgi:DNA-binding transcriptional MocR family regulator
LALSHGCEMVTEPAGLFGWVETGVDTEVLAQRMLDQNILLAPGALFYAHHAPSTRMRINFAATEDAQFWGKFAKQREVLLRQG